MLLLILITLLLFFLLFVPSQVFENFQLKLHKYFKSKNQIKRAESLLLWMDSLGLEQNGLDLGIILPEKDIFMHYGHQIHQVWEDTLTRGGAFRSGISLLRNGLRVDIVRTKKEKQCLNSAFTQILFMEILVFTYLWFFSSILSITISTKVWCFLLLIQALGAFLFNFCLKRLKNHAFGGLHLLSNCLLQMQMISQRGNLGSMHFEANSPLLHGNKLIFFEKMQEVLQIWKTNSVVRKENLLELSEDLSFIHQTSCEQFMGRLKILCFIWSILFILPVLFSASLFGLNEFSIV